MLNMGKDGLTGRPMSDNSISFSWVYATRDSMSSAVRRARQL